jgi:hypothetical protein
MILPIDNSSEGDSCNDSDNNNNNNNNNDENSNSYNNNDDNSSFNVRFVRNWVSSLFHVCYFQYNILDY